MANDHYVAQTYLRNFAGLSGMLRAYRKSDGKTFPCRPRDICAEPNGDVIPDFLSEPGYLGDYRAGFEPAWRQAVDALGRRAVDMDDKLHIAGYWAQLMNCTPTRTRVLAEMGNQIATRTLTVGWTIEASRDKPDEVRQGALEDLERGRITLKTEADFARATGARGVGRLAWALYKADWDVFENDTGVEFLTSDNPAAFEDQGDVWTPSGVVIPFIRYLPVTPRLCIMCDLTRNPAEPPDKIDDLSKEPPGAIRGGPVGRGVVERVNTWIARCAEDLVLASTESDYARDLAARSSRFRIVEEAETFREAGRYVIATRTRCIEQ